MYVQNNNVTYFDSFGSEHIPKKIKTFINNNNNNNNNNKNNIIIKIKITTQRQIFSEYKHDSIMCGYFFIFLFFYFFYFMLMLKTLTEYTNLFSPNNFNKTDDIILNYFMSNI